MKNLRHLREERKITMKALGHEIGVAESTISLYETGKREPDIATLSRLAEFFHVSVDCLLGRDNMVCNREAKCSKSESFIQTVEPISILSSQYCVSDLTFSKISGIPFEYVEKLSVVGAFAGDKTPTKRDIYNNITDEQYHRIACFFCLDKDDLKAGKLPLYPQETVIERIRSDFPDDFEEYFLRELTAAYRRASEDDQSAVRLILKKYSSAPAVSLKAQKKIS